MTEPIPFERGTTEPTNQAVFRAQLEDVEVRDSGAGPDQVTLRGHAAVFDLLSHDLGGFREKIAPGAFRDVLASDPDVHLVQDHDTRLVLGRTRSKTLELREDARGLHVWDRMPPTTYAKDLAILMERGDIDQMSFKFTVDEEEWAEDAEGNVTATILKVRELFDVTVCAQGAYPQTDAQLVRQRFERAIADGRVLKPGRAEPIAADASPGEQAAPIAAPEPGGTASPLGADAERSKRQRELDLARAHTP